jgi:sugar phosphate isomerase/epimerase
MGLKGRLPFRIGTTSYIIPDDIIANVRFLSPLVDDIELVLFESDELSELPDTKTIETLRSIADGDGISYTIHLPLDIRLGHSNRTERKRSVEKCLRVMERTRPLNPHAYILHCNKDCTEPAAVWNRNIENSIDALLGNGFAPGKICPETLDYPFNQIEQLVEDKKLSVCLDIGHILLYRYPLAEYLNRYLKRSRVIHLHGVADGKDHQDISMIDNRSLSLVFSLLHTDQVQQRVVTLEVFDNVSLKKSLSYLEEFMP